MKISEKSIVDPELRVLYVRIKRLIVSQSLYRNAPKLNGDYARLPYKEIDGVKLWLTLYSFKFKLIGMLHDEHGGYYASLANPFIGMTDLEAPVTPENYSAYSKEDLRGEVIDFVEDYF